jgi:AraC-like DNA-binding protein
VREASNRATIEVPKPHDERARKVATVLCTDPADRRSLNDWGLNDWGLTVGASRRTLARAFLADSEISFRRWRTMARRLRHAECLRRRVPSRNRFHSRHVLPATIGLKQLITGHRILRQPDAIEPRC